MKPSLLTAGAVTAVLLAIGAAGLALGDDDDHEHHRKDHDDDRRGGWVRPGEDVAPVTNATYTEECGACHMAYQPGLLPADAWQQIMDPDALTDHYGDDASLSPELRVEIADYLAANSADSASKSRSRAFAVGDSADGALPRISETRYFRNEHHEIPKRLVANNPEVGSFSNCNACHQGAGEGVYNEHRVRIPGYGRWDD
jgi:hypothetical protein